MGKKAFNFNEYHAQRIVRASHGGKDYIMALVRRKYDEVDVEQTGPGEWIGNVEEPVYKMIRDNNEDSDTYGKRIPEPGVEPTRFRRKYTIEFNKESIDNFKKLQGVTNYNKTELCYLWRDGSYTVEDETEFWTVPQKDLYNRVVLGKQTVKVEIDNSGKAKKTSK
jgi:hypothetical protein